MRMVSDALSYSRAAEMTLEGARVRAFWTVPAIFDAEARPWPPIGLDNDLPWAYVKGASGPSSVLLSIRIREVPMRRLIGLLLGVLALSLGACNYPSEESPSDQKNLGKSAATLAQPQ